MFDLDTLNDILSSSRYSDHSRDNKKIGIKGNKDNLDTVDSYDIKNKYIKDKRIFKIDELTDGKKSNK